MKLFKLWVHQQTFSEDPLIVNPKEFPNERVGDILEIYHPEEENTRLLLQINSMRHDFQQKDTISVEQSVANIFQLRTYWDVQVNKVFFNQYTWALPRLPYLDFVYRKHSNTFLGGT